MQDTIKIFSSCASLMIQCLNNAGIVDGQSAFEHHFDNSKGMGLMPDVLIVGTAQKERLVSIGSKT